MRKLVRMALAGAMLTAAPVLADYGNDSPPPTPQTGPSGDAPGQRPGEPQKGNAPPGRLAQAQELYAKGYEDVAKAAIDLKGGRQDDANKRYKNARERLRRAVELDTTIVEAWNLIGFTSRKLGDYPESFAAYRTALRQKPLFGLAREYYGQGLLETGDLDGAKLQLVYLKKIGDEKLIGSLEQSIAEYEEAHGGATAAVSDSSGAGGGH
jgi:tetratricopeptide (TPR) repeat protein